MVFPLIPIAAGLGGTLLGGVFGSLLGGSKKGEATSQQNTTYHPYAFYQPTTSQQIQYPSYQFIIDSPMASQDMTKKQAATLQPSMSAPISAAPIGSSSPETAGASLMPYVLIGGAVVIGYAIITKPPTRRR